MERRLAAILAADVVGYSRLIREDEASTLAALKAHREELIEPKLAQYHGRIVKLMGDGLLAEFPSAVEAVQCAVEIQHMMGERTAAIPEDRRITYRMGINIGDIVVEDDDIYGDGVNVAARLEGLADPGSICVARNVYNQVKDKLDLTFEHLGEKEVKNIAEPVTVYRVVLDEKAAAIATPVLKKVAKLERRWWPVAVGAVAALVVAVGGALWWQPWAPDVEPASVERMAFPLPDKPSIAVLPFDNLSGDPNQEPLSDGITEDIITELSRFRELFVIARHSTLTYKGKPVKVQKVAEDLGVRYVLEGSVRKADDKIRITAQLIDATSGRHVWGEHYDRNLTNLFAIHDEIVGTITTALAVKVHEAERSRTRRKPTDSLDAYDYFLRGRDLQLKHGFFRNEINKKARAFYEEAAAIDREYTRAHAELAWTHLYDFIYGWSAAPEQSRDQALQLAQQAVSMDASNARAHYALGYVQLYRREYDRAIAEIEKAIALNPNDARFRAGMSVLLVYSGKPTPAIEKMQEAMRLNPHHESWYVSFLAWAYFHAQRYDEALAVLKQIAEPRAGTHRTFAAIYARMGRLQEARAHAAKVRELDPGFSVAQFSRSLPYAEQADLDFYLDALREAGLPENPPLPLPDKPSIAVLPFANMSGDPEQEYFADGMTDDLITDLSKISGLFVIARNSVFTYKGRAVKVQDVGRELGVRYVLEGSVRKAGNRVRINAQLVDAQNGHHLWAERFDRELTDVFALQDEVVKRIVAQLAVKLTQGEETRLSRTGVVDPEAYDTLLRGLERYRRFTRETNAEARDFFERAAAIDPSYARAHADVALTYAIDVQFGWTRTPDAAIQTALEHANRALALDPTTHQVHFALGVIYTVQKRHDEAIAAALKAIALYPNYADGYAQLAQDLFYAGEPEASLEAVRKAMRLDPRHPFFYVWIVGQNYMLQQRYGEAVEEFKKVLWQNPEFPGARLTLASTYGLMGRIEDAEWEAEEILTLLPDFTLAQERERVPFKNPEHLERYIAGLRKAGLPE
jgi:adenylate cyclase